MNSTKVMVFKNELKLKKVLTMTRFEIKFKLKCWCFNTLNGMGTFLKTQQSIQEQEQNVAERT